MYDHDSGNKVLNFIFTIIEFFISIILIYLIAVTFGAYLIEDFWETLIFSISMASSSVMSILFLLKHKNPVNILERLLIHHQYTTILERKLVKISYGSIIGAWLGALVIPLDWDRWWQKWPISCLIGAVFGIFFSLLIDTIKQKTKIKQDYKN